MPGFLLGIVKSTTKNDIEIAFLHMWKGDFKFYP